MRTVPIWNLTIYKGADFLEKITCLQSKNGPAVDLSTATFTSSIREHPDFNSTKIASFDISEPTVDGVIYLTLTQLITAAITYTQGYYDLMVSIGGVDVPWLKGDVSFESVKSYTAN